MFSRVLLFLHLALLVATLDVRAQLIAHGTLTEVTSGPYAVGDPFEVRLNLRGEPGTSDVGTSTIVLDFDGAALSFAATPAAGTDFTFANYSGIRSTLTGGTSAYNASVVRTNPSRLTVVIDLGFTTDTRGQALPATATPVVTLRFTVTDPTRTSALVFNNVQLFTGPGQAYSVGTFAGLDVQLPVEFSSFGALSNGNHVELNWVTQSETSNAGFGVERRVANGSEDTWTELGFVEGAGTTAQVQQYAFVDDKVPFTARQVFYRLRQVDFDGTVSLSAEVEVEMALPQEFEVQPVFPNPIRERGTLRVALPQTAEVEATVYDVVGRRVGVLLAGEQEGGRHELPLDTSVLPAGVYFIRVTAGRDVATQRMVVVR